jgi:uncharacterized protein (TIGR03086 family)
VATFGAQYRGMETTTDTQTLLDIDPRILLAAATATATEVVGAVRPEQLADPTPCTEYDVRDLLGHLVGVAHRITLMGRGEDPMSAPDLVDDVADGAWTTTWVAAVAEARAAWTDDAALDRTVVLPWATDTGGVALLGYVSELTVHTWDIAHATGQHPEWNVDVVGHSLDLIRIWLPGEHRAEIFAEVRKQMGVDAASAPDPFAAVVPVADDAPLIDRLVAWNGRRP